MVQDQSVKNLLDKNYLLYNHSGFIENDPVQIPHRFAKKEDIEIAGFLSATIAWGQRKSIIKNCQKLMSLMDNSPFDFIVSANENEIMNLNTFVHRTFQGVDCVFFIRSLRNIYVNQNGLEEVFAKGYNLAGNIFRTLDYFRKVFLATSHIERNRKHVADVLANASAKRLNMFLRWMVRKDDNGVDFGIWRHIPMSSLMLPLDVHTGNVARELGILQRKQNDWKAVEEITSVLRTFDPADPVKYDFALFGIGVNNESVRS
jgi:uncharacterized protein (TIGR02757 family)